MQDYIFDYLEELPPEIKAQLEKLDVYQSFIAAREGLNRTVYKSWAETGKLNSREALAQSSVVTKLGSAVLESVKVLTGNADPFQDKEAAPLTLENARGPR